MPILNQPSDESGDGVLIGKSVWQKVDVSIATLLIEKSSSTLTIYFPLSIRKKVSKVGTVILRDYLPELGYSPSVIRVINVSPNQKRKSELSIGKREN